MAIFTRPLPLVAALVVAAAVALVAIALVADDDRTQVTGGDATTTLPATNTTERSTTTTLVPDTSTAVWPWASGDTRYDDPVDAARGFATDLVGFTAPVMGAFQAGDARSGEVEVRASASGAVTTVFVRQLGTDGSWWVLGAASPNIVVEQPGAGSTITSPVHLAGRSRAFEAQVDVAVLQDGSPVPLGRGYVMGSGDAELRPFAADLGYEAPDAELGAVALTTSSAEDGRIWEASVVRVRFGDRGATVESMAVTVWFTDAVMSRLVPATREVPKTTGVLRASVDQLLRGPTLDERRVEGLTSWFSDATAGLLHSVDLDRDGRAVVDFADLRPVIPNASTSAGSALLLAQLDATVFQHPSVMSVEYRIDGSCSTFFEWLQMRCSLRERDRWTPPPSG
jgi:hypothetical protein